MSDEEKKPLELVAGVFMNPETEQLETHTGREGINPMLVFLDVLERNLAEIRMILMQQQQKQSRIQKAPPGFLGGRG